MSDNSLEILNNLTIEQKISLLNGSGNWNTVDYTNLGLKSIAVSDGPHGLRKEVVDIKGKCVTLPATCFPTAVTLASSWDTELVYTCGESIANECKAQDVSILLGPGINIKRSPLCGRNFEYFSEDPFLAGKIAAGFIKGLQENNVGTSLKHFACNNQETDRKIVSAQVDERALREIYLLPFEIAVKDAQPYTVMSAYNRINGQYASESRNLLTKILRDEWGFEGVVVSDWESLNNRPAALAAGVDLEMPDSNGNGATAINKALASGEITVTDIDNAVLRLIKLIQKCNSNKKSINRIDFEQQHNTAKNIMTETAVLLKNDGALPLLSSKNPLLVIGALAEKPIYQGNGSSRINANKVIGYIEALKCRKIDYRFEKGYSLKKNCYNKKLIEKSVAAAKKSRNAVVFIGLTENYESEGYDRANLKLPFGQLELMKELCKTNCDLTVVLMCGSPVELPFVNEIKALLNVYLGGEGVGEGLVELLYGEKNPCGKLAETFPLKLEDNINSDLFPMGTRFVEYRESVFVGYRYYDTAEKEVLFPFGHGLSYSKFEYSDIRAQENAGKVTVKCKVKNCGNIYGKEIVQLYIHDVESTIFRPKKELKGFVKIALNPDEEKDIAFLLDKRAFAFYNTNSHSWQVEEGSFDLLIGASSRDIRISQKIYMQGDASNIPNFRGLADVYYNMKDAKSLAKEDFSKIYNKTLPNNSYQQKGEYNMDSTFSDIRSMWIGKTIDSCLKLYGRLFLHWPDGEYKLKQVYSSLEVPLIREAFDKGKINEECADGLVELFNKNAVTGFTKFIKAKRNIKKRLKIK